ncbi:hypothetical protein OHB00_09115 [Streptomyces sp. NBC_00631]|uniref:hypothetical protein n=1 Tax=Streptomyces sp. NBC_00631 TaxID=2975793 RepID=UPI0030E02589
MPTRSQALRLTTDGGDILNPAAQRRPGLPEEARDAVGGRPADRRGTERED